MFNTQILLTRLQTQAAPAIEDLTAAPFFASAAKKELPLESYIHFLRAKRALLQPCTPSPLVPGLADVASTLDQDLANFREFQVADNPSVTLATLALTERVRARYTENPAKLFGYLFIMLDVSLLQKLDPAALADLFKRPVDQGFRFLETIQTAGNELWSGLLAEGLETLPAAAAESDALIAAQVAITGLKKLYRTLHPLETENYRNLVMDINPKAGSHAIPDDPLEIQAAIRAGEITLIETPYFEWRFGDLANKFAHSDSAWLAALTRLSASAFAQQIDWLARLLATRGMPQWVVEAHLRNLYTELLQVRPENTGRYQKISDTVVKMQAARESIIAAEDFNRLSSEFETRTNQEWPELNRNVGKILVAAVADEAGGIKNAVESVRGWLTNPDRFSPEWVAAVEAVLTAAQTSTK